MSTSDWKEAAEKWLKNFIQQHTHEDEVSPMEWAAPEDIGRDAFIAGAEHACEQLKQQLEVSAENYSKLMQRLEDAEAALKHYAGRTVSVKDGHIRLNYHGTEDGPGMCFYQGEEWIIGDFASAYFAKHAGGQHE